MKEALSEVRVFKTGRIIINKITLVDDKALIAKTQEELQDWANGLVDNARKYSMNGNQHRQVTRNEIIHEECIYAD